MADAMSNVVALWRRPSDANARGVNRIYLALRLASGPHASLAKLMGLLRHSHPSEIGGGEYAMVGETLLHLAGWTTCRTTAGVMSASLKSQGDPVELLEWPHDVSAWPGVRLADAPSLWHVAPEAMKSLGGTHGNR